MKFKKYVLNLIQQNYFNKINDAIIKCDIVTEYCPYCDFIVKSKDVKFSRYHHVKGCNNNPNKEDTIKTKIDYISKNFPVLFNKDILFEEYCINKLKYHHFRNKYGIYYSHLVLLLKYFNIEKLTNTTLYNTERILNDIRRLFNTFSIRLLDGQPDSAKIMDIYTKYKYKETSNYIKLKSIAKIERPDKVYNLRIKEDNQHNYFVEGLNVSNCHSVAASSVKKVINLCANAVYRFGVSGTITDDDSAEAWTAQAFLGPQVMKVSPDFLMKEGYATQVKIKQFHLNYISDEIRSKLAQLRNNRDQVSGSKLLNLEEQLVVDNEKRFYFVVNLALKTTKNTVMLFSNVKDNYGKRIYDEIRERSSEKEVFYIFGGTPVENRDYIFKKMEEGTNKILVASFGTVSTGISIKNIGNIIFLESYKSSTIIKQSIGRGMRLHGDKEGFTVIDLVDDFRAGKTPNYLWAHGKERLAIYKRENFPVEIFTVNL